ncbi:MAG: metallophosphoesterase family protein [Gemmatimonadaceae bacterium]
MTATAEELALAGASVLVGAGDIATCNATGDEQTAVLVDSILKADSVAGVSDAVFTTGDNVYPSGREVDFTRCFTPSWGSPNRRIMKKIYPAVGNHEYDTEGAVPYYAYFGERAGPPGKGYFAYKIGEWRAIVLNSEIATNPRFTAVDKTAQEEWLRKELADNPTKCTLAYWHHPRFSSSFHGPDAEMLKLFQILYEGNVDLALVGHDHTYERFEPQTAAGARDTLRGIPQIVIGTGGANLRGFRSPVANSAVRIEGYYGILKLTLGKEEFQRAFIDTDRRIWDPGRGRCH